METDTKHNESGKLSGVLGVIEKLWEWPWAFRICIFVLFTDSALLYLNGEGLLNWQATSQYFSQHLGTVISVFALFGLFVTFVVLAIEYFFREIFFLMYYHGGLSRLFYVEEVHQRSNGIVYSRELYKEALRTGNPLMLKLYDENREQYHEFYSSNELLRQLTFTFLLLILINWWLPFSDAHHSIISSFITHVGEFGRTIVLCAVLVLSYLLMRTWLPESRHLDEIYYPPLYDEIDKKEKEEKRKRYEYEKSLEVKTAALNKNFWK